MKFGYEGILIEDYLNFTEISYLSHLAIALLN